MSTIVFTSFPKTQPPPNYVLDIVSVFSQTERLIATQDRATGLKSDEVLALLRPGMIQLGIEVEHGKAKDQKLERPVFFGENGTPEKQYSIDAFWPQHSCGIEVEAGRAVGGNAIYRDLIQALVMVDLTHLCLAVPNVYRYGKTQTYDYRSTTKIADALFSHDRIRMPYGLTVIGY